MHDLGYVEGKNLHIEWRFADGKSERLPELAAELVQLRVEVIFTHATPGILAAKAATSTIPIVFTAVTDPVRRGIAMSLARPGGNITGTANFALELLDKQLELRKRPVSTQLTWSR
jgi:putative ABC transport system substrate-binding protein